MGVVNQWAENRTGEVYLQRMGGFMQENGVFFR